MLYIFTEVNIEENTREIMKIMNERKLDIVIGHQNRLVKDLNEIIT